MEPFSEHTHHGKTAFHDYWDIGGRYTGNHDNYDPYDDPTNYEVCDLCQGTGKRTDIEDAYRGCNACSGTGLKIKYNLEPHPEDILPLKDIRTDLTCYTLIVSLDKIKKAKVFHKETWTGSNFVSTEFHGTHIQEFLKTKFKITDGFLVTLDYHS